MVDRQVVWVAGGRDFTNVFQIRDGLRRVDEDALLVTGAARGADTVAETYWRSRQRPYAGLPADWDHYPKAAGPIRNYHIAVGAVFPVPDVLLVFPGGRGTVSAIELAENNAIQVIYG